MVKNFFTIGSMLLLSVFYSFARGQQVQNNPIDSFHSSLSLNSDELPTIFAVGGEGTNVNWALIKAEADKDPEGPGFFYQDCSEGLDAINASSVLPPQGVKSYSMANLEDYNPMTAWVEGKSDYGIGEFFEVKAPDVTVIYNGYQSSPSNWKNNSRVKKFKVYKNNLPLCYLILTDEMGGQYFDLPVPKEYDFDNPSLYRFEIVEVYPGLKWPDVAISEVDFRLCCFGVNTSLLSSDNELLITALNDNTTISTIDLQSGKLKKVEVVKKTSQIHAKLYRLQTATKSIDITANHPLYTQQFGFVSLAKLATEMKIERFEELVDRVEFLVWNADKGMAEYERLTYLSVLEGRLETYTLQKLSEGSTYIANGFVTKTY
jgi:hypothetical protein